jgi:hypothetical protein
METYENESVKAQVLLALAEGKITQEAAEFILPELKETEDEKIKKELINFFKNDANEWYPKRRHSVNQIVTWIEKHGDIKYPRFRVGDTIRLKGSFAEYTITSISDGAYHGKGWDLGFEYEDDYELVQWSPDDQKMLEGIIKEIEANNVTAPLHDKKAYGEFLNWLNLIKRRIQPPGLTWNKEDEENLNDICSLTINNMSAVQSEDKEIDLKYLLSWVQKKFYEILGYNIRHGAFHSIGHFNQ